MIRHRLLRRLRLITLALVLSLACTTLFWSGTVSAQNGVGSGPPLTHPRRQYPASHHYEHNHHVTFHSQYQ